MEVTTMHEINKLRLQAGLSVDAKYEAKDYGNINEKDEAIQPTIDYKKLHESSQVIVDLQEKTIEHSKQKIQELEKLVASVFEGFSAEVLNEKMFKKNQDVEDVKTGVCYKIVKPVGHDDSDDVVYDVVCPKTGETFKKSASTLTSKVNKVKEAVEVLNTSNDDQQDKTPAIVTPQPQKTKVPAFIKNDLAKAITHFKDESKKLAMHDKANSLFQEQIADALERIQDLMINDIKQAQIFLTSLMGPILHKVPSSVCKFIYSGGDVSLKTFFNK